MEDGSRGQSLWRSLNILHGKYSKEKKSTGNEDARYRDTIYKLKRL